MFINPSLTFSGDYSCYADENYFVVRGKIRLLLIIKLYFSLRIIII